MEITHTYRDVSNLIAERLRIITYICREASKLVGRQNRFFLSKSVQKNVNSFFLSIKNVLSVL
jgi:hypothetical protein